VRFGLMVATFSAITISSACSPAAAGFSWTEEITISPGLPASREAFTVSSVVNLPDSLCRVARDTFDYSGDQLVWHIFAVRDSGYGYPVIVPAPVWCRIGGLDAGTYELTLRYFFGGVYESSSNLLSERTVRFDIGLPPEGIADLLIGDTTARQTSPDLNMDGVADVADLAIAINRANGRWSQRASTPRRVNERIPQPE
jgi:hypothetical protein